MLTMSASDPKADLHRYLQTAREVLLWKLDGLSEYDIRRPLVPTGTNLLGLIKHVASVERATRSSVCTAGRGRIRTLPSMR
jgi:Protein of unknown function (DUF664)